MKITKCIKYLPLLLASTLVWGADQAATTDKPYLYTSQTAEITASVEAIDHETRRVTLQKPDGTSVTFTASEEARNLDQVMVGDIVHAKYMESITIEVVANEGMEPQSQELAAVARTEEGQMPGMAAFDAQVVTAVVEEINIEANTYKLKGPDGNITEYVAMDPENLKRADVGDLVIITTAESLAISVEMGPVE